MNLKNISIKVKLIMFFALVSTILFITVGLLFFESNKSVVMNSKQKEFGTLSEETANKIERFLSERYGDIEVMCTSSILSRKDVAKEIKLEYINSVRDAYKTYEYILTTDNYGNIETISGNLNGDISYIKWIKNMKDTDFFVSDFIYMPKDKAYFVYFIAPIKDKTGLVTGRVVEKVQFNAINDIVKNVSLGKSGYAYLLSNDGNNILYPKKNVPSVNLSKNRGKIYYNNYSEGKYVYSFYPLKKYQTQKNTWYLVTEQSEREAFQVSYNLRNFTVIVVAISIFIIFILALIASEKITKPFKIMNLNLKSMEQRVIKMSDELEKSVIRAKNLEDLAAMSAGMAHEIRNPLTSISGYAQYIQLELSQSSKLQEDISIIIDEVDRLNRIVDRFLSFARPKELKLKLEDINVVVKSAIKILNNELSCNNVKLDVNLNKVPEILIDRDQIYQVILNIAINGIQSMPQGGILNISTGYIKSSKTVYIDIEDTGVGIEDYDKIFQPFFTTKDKGVGLGLPICLRIIQNHNGFIEVRKKEDKGTKFIIKIPLKGV